MQKGYKLFGARRWLSNDTIIRMTVNFRKFFPVFGVVFIMERDTTDSPPLFVRIPPLN